jgi:ATP-dependent RNA helicase RhlE
LKLHPSLQKGLKELGFQRPTPIQTEAIPGALEGRDVLACAMTGSGKTAAFLLPILHQLIAKPRGKTRALVVTPTRELAAQILTALDSIAIHTPITAAAIYGGVGMAPQACDARGSRCSDCDTRPFARPSEGALREPEEH